MAIEVCILFILFLFIFPVFFSGLSGVFVALFLSHYMWNLPLPLIKGLYQRGSKDISSGSGLEWVETNGLLPSP